MIPDPRAMRVIEHAATRMAAAFALTDRSAKSAVRALSRFGDGLMYCLAAPKYAEAHGGRLPGSEHTARLRKKRRDAVLRWWREQ